MDESFTSNYSFSNARSPLSKENGASKRDFTSSYYSTSNRFDASSAASQTTFDLAQAKIDHLERERIELCLQIHQQSEKDRAKKIKMEQLESQLKSSEKAQQDLNRALEAANMLTASLKADKDSLENEIKQLKTHVEQQVTAAAESRNLWVRMTAASRELKRIEEEATKLRREKVDMTSEKNDMTKAIDDLKEKSEENEKEIVSLRDAKAQLEADYALQKSQWEGESSLLKQQLDDAKASQTKLEEQMERQRMSFEYDQEQFVAEIKSLREQLVAKAKEYEVALLKSQGQVEDGDLENADMGTTSAEALAVVKDLREKLLQSELKRKQLHNALQELRGNIRVFVRCRPFLRGDGEEATASSDPTIGGSVRFHKDGTSVSLAGSARGNQVFTFDHVFRCDTTQDQVYKEVTDLVQSVLDGYKVCIFSYGQTGSGKTHTMSGEKDGANRGIIPRSVEQIIENTIRMREEGWEVVVTASMVEIYNEELRDLLITNSAAATAADKDKNKLKISFLQGYVTVAGLTSVELDTSDLWSGMRHLDQLLDRASRSRATACTAMNERSSRSHAIFMLDISAKHTEGGTFLRGGLRLCDLAGSERLDRTGTINDAVRLKETVNINKSLSCLADVFVALANKAQHIPYRNSKLTMLLQDCLSGDGKALMFVNVSPTSASAQETLCSLRFANQVSQVELGKAQKNVFSLMPAQLAPPPPPPAASVQMSRASTMGRSSRASIMPAPTASTYRGDTNNTSITSSGSSTAAPTMAIGGLVSVPEEEDDEESSSFFPPPPPHPSSTSSRCFNENADPNIETSFTRVPASTLKPFSNSAHQISSSPSRVPALAQVSALSKAPIRPAASLKRPAGMLGTTAGVGGLSHTLMTSQTASLVGSNSTAGSSLRSTVGVASDAPIPKRSRQSILITPGSVTGSGVGGSGAPSRTWR